MTRKQFIESTGATCRNWTWSWSFINKRKKFIIFGAWDNWTEEKGVVILDEAWQRNSRGRKNSAYPEAREHIGLIESGEYVLKTFPLIYSDELKDEQGHGPSKIKEFGHELTERNLRKIGQAWYALDEIPDTLLPEEISKPEKYVEGASTKISVNAYERNAKARAACIKHYGAKCVICAFDFEVVFGKVAAGFIHVHHLVPLAGVKRAYKVDPIKDLRPVCPNCHAIIHLKQPALTIDQLRRHLDRE